MHFFCGMMQQNISDLTLINKGQRMRGGVRMNGNGNEQQEELQLIRRGKRQGVCERRNPFGAGCLQF